MRTLAETEGISAQDVDLLRDVKEIVQGSLPDATVLLYGSVARGTQSPDSDYDILVLTDRALSCGEEDRVCDDLYDLQLAHGVLIATMFYPKSAWDTHVRMPLHQEVDRDGVLL